MAVIPMLVRPVTRRRYSSSTAFTDTTIRAEIQPVPGQSVKSLPDGVRIEDARKLYSAPAYDVRTAEVALGLPPDLILDGGITYQVEGVQDWSQSAFIRHYDALLVRRRFLTVTLTTPTATDYDPAADSVSDTSPTDTPEVILSVVTQKEVEASASRLQRGDRRFVLYPGRLSAGHTPSTTSRITLPTGEVYRVIELQHDAYGFATVLYARRTT